MKAAASFLRTLMVENFRQLELVTERLKMSRVELSLILKTRGLAPSGGYATVGAWLLIKRGPVHPERQPTSKVGVRGKEWELQLV